jgi:hypothetical protein
LVALDHSEDGSSGDFEDAEDDCDNQLKGSYRVVGDRLSIHASSYALKACLVSKNKPSYRDLPNIFNGQFRFRIHGEFLEFLTNEETQRLALSLIGKDEPSKKFARKLS